MLHVRKKIGNWWLHHVFIVPGQARCPNAAPATIQSWTGIKSKGLTLWDGRRIENHRDDLPKEGSLQRSLIELVESLEKLLRHPTVWFCIYTFIFNNSVFLFNIFSGHTLYTFSKINDIPFIYCAVEPYWFLFIKFYFIIKLFQWIFMWETYYFVPKTITYFNGNYYFCWYKYSYQQWYIENISFVTPGSILVETSFYTLFS